VDVWALGVILYECLTGVSPFRAATVLDSLWKVVNEEPVSPRERNAKVPRDLETICLKAMAKAPGQRYATARAMADDLRRFLRGEPILARPVSTWERGWRWVQRRPAAAGLLLVSFIALLTSIVAGVALVAFRETRQARHEAELARELAEDQRLEAEKQRGVADANRL
jgi:serine/threonine protein kinase